MLSILFFSTFFLTLSLLFLSFSLYTNKLRSPRPESNPDTAACKDDSISPPAPELSLAESEGLSGQPDRDSDPAQGQGPKRKKKKSKRPDLDKEEEQSIGGGDEKKVVGSGLSADLGSRDKPELICLYPFTSSGSATQRRIKQQYDELVKSHDSKGLALAQVDEFAKCLVEARNELQHNSVVIHRKFPIAKALLFKADKSSFDQVRQQIYKLELEQKRLEEDAFAYNWLQQQLKISPAYKKILEISASRELKAKSGELVESKDADLPEILFEEFLAQEKKDSFWQKLGKSRSCTG
ncbi:uncharacterized protein LOC116201726 [Punica granatum]|uniref:Uncharacterized protein LOC116201726 n=1 Tax=Punica granatum TaxID=22663 RepID=A0A6P8CY00_PUNGR|nr:uncharacterized protein LOC116201726 [Punica granatum]